MINVLGRLLIPVRLVPEWLSFFCEFSTKV